MPVDRVAAASRDAGLHRVSRLTRWLLAGALALTGAFSAIAARAFPGSTTPTTGQAGSSGQTGSSPSDEDTAGGGLQAPATPPSASSGPGAVTSGGS
jgi:hypothetical protein